VAVELTALAKPSRSVLSKEGKNLTRNGYLFSPASAGAFGALGGTGN